MRSLAARHDARRGYINQADRMVGGERLVDRGDTPQAHVRTQATHPLGGAVTADLRDVGDAPFRTFRITSIYPTYAENVTCTRNDLLIAHFHFENRIRRSQRRAPPRPHLSSVAGSPDSSVRTAARRERNPHLQESPQARRASHIVK